MSDNMAYIKYSILLLVIVAGTLCLTCWPVFHKINVNQEHIYELLDNLNQADVDTAKMISTYNQINMLKDRIAREHKIIPTNDDLSGLRSKLGIYIGQLPLSGHNFKKGNDIQSSNLHNLTLKVDTSGEFIGVFQLIQYIESLPRLIRIREVNVAKKSSPDNDTVNANITIDAFYMGSDDSNDLTGNGSG